MVLFLVGIVSSIVALFYGQEISFFDITVFGIHPQTLFSERLTIGFLENNILDEISGVLAIVGGCIFAFSKEKKEDEFINKIRLESLIWATYANYLLLLFAVLFVYDTTFFYAIVYNAITILIIFISRFQWSLSKLTKEPTQ